MRPFWTITTATDSFIRSLPEDGMNGFFVACLERREPALNLKRKAEAADDDDDDLDSLAVHEILPSVPKKKKKRKKQKTVDWEDEGAAFSIRCFMSPCMNV
jgi:hypothetical protein